jgi:hypothetical protein
MVLGAIRAAATRGGARLASFFGGSTGRAAGGGLLAGVALDDVPVVGPAVDPTEASGGVGLLQLVLLGGLAVLGLLVADGVLEEVSDT